MRRAHAPALALLLGACAGDAGDTGDGDGDGDGDATPSVTFPCPGGTVAPGVNTLRVGERDRTYHAAFPADTSAPMGVLFSWHGFGETMDAFVGVGLDPDAVDGEPMIVVTPEDTRLVPPAGLGWDIRAAEPNIDVDLFEAMLGCLAEQYPIDPARVHSFGFSAGSVMTSLLHSRHPRLLRSVVAMSGAWFNDPAQAAMVNLFEIDWDWPALAAGDGGAVLLTHGGPDDVTVLDVMDLEASAQAALPFLTGGGREVLDCPHQVGHALHPELDAAMIGAFLAGGRDGFPAGCTLRESQTGAE